jgi:hypothetical protein
MMTTAATVVLLAASPIVAFAIYFPPGYAKILNSIYIGPCVNWKFMYLICAKSPLVNLKNLIGPHGIALKSLLMNNWTASK